MGSCSVQFSSVTQSCPTLCDPMNRSTPGLPVHHQLPESTQTHVYWLGDAIQPSPRLSSPSPSALNLSQHQSLFQWVSSLHQVAKVWSFSFNSVIPVNHQGWFHLGLTGLISLLSKELSRVFSSTTVWIHQFFGAQPSLWFSSHTCTWLLEKPYLWLNGPLLAKSLLFGYVGHSFSSKEQVSFNFMAAVTICSDFGAPQK